MMSKILSFAYIAGVLFQLQLISAKSIYGNLTQDDVSYVYSGQFKIMLEPLSSIVRGYEYLIGNLTETINERDSVPEDFNSTLENIVANSTGYLNNLPALFENLENNLIEDKDNILEETTDDSMVANATLGEWLFYNHWCFTIFYAEATENLTNTDSANDELLAFVSQAISSNVPDSIETTSTEGDGSTYISTSSGSTDASKKTSSSSISGPTTSSGNAVTATSTYTVNFKRWLQRRDVTDADFGDWAETSLETVASPMVTLIEEYQELVEDIIKVLNKEGTLTDDDLQALSNVITYSENIINSVIPEAATYLGDAFIYENNITVNDQTMILANFDTLKTNSVSQLSKYLAYFTDDGSFSNAYTTLLADIATSSSISSSTSVSTTYSTTSSPSSTSTTSNILIITSSSESSQKVLSSPSLSVSLTLNGSSSMVQTIISSSKLSPWFVSNSSSTYTGLTTTSTGAAILSTGFATTSTESTLLSTASKFNSQKITTSSNGKETITSSNSAKKTNAKSTITKEEGHTSGNNIATTVLTITRCSDHKCSKVPITTGLLSYTSNVNNVLTVYTTFCPLTGSSANTEVPGSFETGSGSKLSGSSNTGPATDIEGLNSLNGINEQSQLFSEVTVSRTSSVKPAENTLQTSSQASSIGTNPSANITAYEGKAAIHQYETSLILFIMAAALL